MNRREFIDQAGRTGFFFARHSLAIFVTAAVACVLWTILYGVLLVWAVLAGGGIGSPVAYPLGLLAVLVGSTALAVTLLFPCTALAEWIASRRGWPIFAQIPINAGILAGICAIVVGFAALTGSEVTLGMVIIGYGGLFSAGLLPLGLYWWTMQSGPLAISLFRFVRRRFHAAANGPQANESR